MAQNDAPASAKAPEQIEVESEIVACDGGAGRWAIRGST